MQTESSPSEYKVNPSMVYAYDERKVAPEDAGNQDRGTLKGGVPQIDLNKGMGMGDNITDRFEDFFLENKEKMTDRTRTPVPKAAVLQ